MQNRIVFCRVFTSELNQGRRETRALITNDNGDDEDEDSHSACLHKVYFSVLICIHSFHAVQPTFFLGQSGFGTESGIFH